MQMKNISSHSGWLEVRSALADFFWSFGKGRIWFYNIRWDNKERISHLLQLYPITAVSILLTSNLFASKKENPEPILAVKIIGWRKFINYFGLSIEVNQSRAGKKKIYFVHIGYITSPSSVISIKQGTILKNSLICNQKRCVCIN